MPTLLAYTYYGDAQCTSPLRIQYNQVDGGGDCSSSYLRLTCTVSTSNPGFWYKSECAPDLATFGAKVFNSSIAQFQTLSTDPCGQPPTDGRQFPLNTCVAQAYKDQAGNVVFQGNKAVVDPSSGQLSLITFNSDPTCATTNIQRNTVGSITAPSSCLSGATSSLIGFTALLTATTTYSGSDCKTPVKLSYEYAARTCTASTKCSLNSDTGEWITTACSKTNDLDASAQSLFSTTPYFTFQPYYDTSCTVVKPAQAIRLDVCFPSSTTKNVVNSVIAKLSPDQNSVTINSYQGPSCQGSAIEGSYFSFGEACGTGTPGAVKLNVKPAASSVVGVVTTAAATLTQNNGGNSGTPVGAIVGGVVGTLAVLAAVGFGVWYMRYKNIKKDPSEDRTKPRYEPVQLFTSRELSLQELERQRQLQQQPLPSNASAAAFSFAPSQFATDESRRSRRSGRSGRTSAAPPPSSFMVSMTTSGPEPTNPEKQRANNLFGTMNETIQSVSKHLEARTSQAGLRERGADVETAYFGELVLPALPSEWTIQDVVDWVSLNEGTQEILLFINEQEIDGRALLKMNVKDFAFPTVGRRLRFQEALDSLIALNEQKKAAKESLAPPPCYQN
ncbi:hypothetical protein HDU79_007774 [Rhizoclosmatium sp. JEL0117]|nr:hypothetical protein HDU79_007774 [Rhizoclosmatium sp. JEL0117]